MLIYVIEGRVYSFSMQVIMNKCFLLNPKKKKFGADPACRFREKIQKALFISEK